MKLKCVGLRYLDKEPRTFVGKAVIEESKKEYEVTLTDENAPKETILVKVRLANNGKELYILTQEPLEHKIRHYFYLWESGKKFILQNSQWWEPPDQGKFTAPLWECEVIYE